MPRCNDCDKSVGWEEIADSEWTTKNLDGYCYNCKLKQLDSEKDKMRLKALLIINKYGD